MNKRDEINELIAEYHKAEGYTIQNADRIIRLQRHVINHEHANYEFFKWGFAVCWPLAFAFVLALIFG